MEKEYRDTSKIVSKITYRFCFCTRYRQRIFKNEGIKSSFIEKALEIANLSKLRVCSIDLQEDFVLMCIEAPPDVSPKQIMARIKGGTSSQLRSDFKELASLPAVWTRHFIVTTDNQWDNIILEQFLESQKRGKKDNHKC